ncbi:hypothetical protein PR048_008817 [Dryococelus australis]|uniref:Transposase n=1 Tax=Dryococelus australis TaxID=614101 RepID=A0ABQ9HY57_9NEOP|nr:hypothetical protein PR048_008817 [Dryococelus australis]
MTVKHILKEKTFHQIGRPKAHFSQGCSEKKIINAKTLTQSLSPEELALAAQLSYRTSGKRNVAEIIKRCNDEKPTISNKRHRSWSGTVYTKEALGLTVDVQILRDQYVSLRRESKKINACIYPLYRQIKKNKREDEFQFIENQIRLLEPTKVCIENMTHVLIKTMVDGKVCNAVVQNPSAQICYICGASPKQMNNLKVEKTTFNFGLSTPRAQIRFFKCSLHKSYRLQIKK